MTEKRFTVLKKLENSYIEADVIDTYIERLVKDGKSVGWVTVGILDKGNPITYKDCVDLLNENEQLKKQNKRLEEKIQRERNSFTKTHERWSKEAENKIKELSEENEQLKKELLFFYDVANCECSTNWKGDMEKGCKRFFNCTYEEAKEKYGDYDGMWWEIND